MVFAKISESSSSQNCQNSFVFLLCHLTITSLHSNKVATVFPDIQKKECIGGIVVSIPKKGRVFGGGVGSNIKIYIQINFAWNINSLRVFLCERGMLEEKGELGGLSTFTSLLDKRWRG